MFLTGCITMAGNKLDDLAPTAGTLSPAVEQTVGEFSFHLDGGKMITSDKFGRELNDETLGRWKKSGFIADHHSVKSSRFSDESKYRITLGGRQDGESSIFLQIISGATLAVIPYQVDSRMELRYSLENAESGCIFEASASDSYKSVVGLLLLPIAPFAQGGRTKTFERMANNLYDQLASQGAFDQHASCLEDTASDAGTEGRGVTVRDISRSLPGGVRVEDIQIRTGKGLGYPRPPHLPKLNSRPRSPGDRRIQGRFVGVYDHDEPTPSGPTRSRRLRCCPRQSADQLLPRRHR